MPFAKVGRNSGDSLAFPAASQGTSEEFIPLWIVFAGLCFLYGPSFIDLFEGLWSTPEQAHGPIVLAVSLWLLYRQWPEMLRASAIQKGSIIGWPLLVVGLAFYLVGRSQHILVLEIGSFVLVVGAVCLLMLGGHALRAQWFALLFMLFMIPLPGVVVDGLTMPMKSAVSWACEQTLHLLGYPIARSGVILHIGQYKLLVADACAGLHTLFSLEALGLLYLKLSRSEAAFRNVALAFLVIPISFAANVIRVIFLTLITFHFGDAAGQGFLHGFAGLVLFMTALALIVGADIALRSLSYRMRAAANDMTHPELSRAVR